MGKFSGILMVSDVDGTLIDHFGEISDENVAAIEYFQREGGKFTLATGRLPCNTDKFLRVVRLDVPAICGNGLCIYDTETREVTTSNELDESALRLLELVSVRFPKTGIEVFWNDVVYVDRPNDGVREHLAYAAYRPVYMPFNEAPRPWMKINLVLDPADADIAKEWVCNLPESRNFEIFKSDAIFLEILPKEINKGSTLKEITRRLGIDMKDVVAIGDHENDISMIREAGLGVAVADAVPELKAEADLVGCKNTEHIIKYIVEKLENR